MTRLHEDCVIELKLNQTNVSVVAVGNGPGIIYRIQLILLLTKKVIQLLFVIAETDEYDLVKMQ